MQSVLPHQGTEHITTGSCTATRSDAYDTKKATLLKPGYLADWNKTNKSVKIEKADIEVKR